MTFKQFSNYSYYYYFGRLEELGKVLRIEPEENVKKIIEDLTACGVQIEETLFSTTNRHVIAHPADQKLEIIIGGELKPTCVVEFI